MKDFIFKSINSIFKKMNHKSYLSASALTLFIVMSFMFIGTVKKQKAPDRIITKDLWDSLLQGGEHFGPADAPVTIVEFIDFQCIHCKHFSETLREFEKNYPKKIRVIVHNFPLVQHPQAKMAAISAVCASEMGNYKKYNELLFDNQSLLFTQPWDSLAKRSGVEDIKKFNGCMANDAPAMKKLKKDFQLALQIRLIETPTIIINRQLYNGSISYSELKAAVKRSMKGGKL